MRPKWEVTTIMAVLVFAALGLAGCSRPKPVVAPEVAPPAAESGMPATATPSGEAVQVQKEPTVTTAQIPESGVGASELPTSVEELNKAGFVKDVYFDTNKADLRDDAREILAGDAAWLNAHPSVKILVEGHCDERNTEEYNLALGWKRSNVAKGYLSSLGVDAGRIDTISYGESRPFATGHDEGSWWQNRRARFVVVAR
jgi:peptidoglycan-associated lipoprotein